MMKKCGMRTAALSIMLITALAGCSSTGSEREDYKKDAGKAPPLEVPPGLVLPKADDHYLVPDGGETATNYSDYAKSNAAQNQACTCKDSAVVPVSGVQPAPLAVVAPVAPPKLQDLADGSKNILISEPFDRCWLKVDQALDHAHVVVEDKDRSNGQFFLKGGKNQVTVKTVTAGCEVAANNGKGASNSDTKNVIDTIYKNLGK